MTLVPIGRAEEESQDAATAREVKQIMSAATVQAALPEILKALDLLEKRMESEAFQAIERGERLDDQRAIVILARKHAYASLRKVLTNQVKIVQATVDISGMVPHPPERSEADNG